MKAAPEGASRYDRLHGDEPDSFVACEDLLHTLDRMRGEWVSAHSADTAKELLCWVDRDRYLIQAFVHWMELVRELESGDPVLGELVSMARRQKEDLLYEIAEDCIAIEDAEREMSR